MANLASVWGSPCIQYIPSNEGVDGLVSGYSNLASACVGEPLCTYHLMKALMGLSMDIVIWLVCGGAPVYVPSNEGVDGLVHGYSNLANVWGNPCVRTI